MLKKENYKIFVRPKKNKNYLVVVLIGKKITNEWEKYSKKLMVNYCRKNLIGLISFHKDLTVDKGYYSQPVFNKYLFADYFNKNLRFIENVCYLDHDILCNPNGPNIFNYFKKGKFNVVSKYKNLPYPQSDDFLRRRAAFNRKAYYDKSFPLDSSLTISRKKTFNYHGWPDQGDYFCSGVIMFNVKQKASFFKKVYLKYCKKNFFTMTTGEEPIINYEILKTKKINWLDYKFQVLWLLEMNSKYPFLYKLKKNKNIIKACIENSISENCFIHFAGKWPEGQMWKQKNLFNLNTSKFYNRFKRYLDKKLKSQPRKNLIKFKN